MTRFRKPSLTEQEILDGLEIRLLETSVADAARFEELMVSHHYLKSDRLVGEQLRYVVQVKGQWVALLSWSAAAYHLKHREKWIGWSEAQRRRRMALVANNARFSIFTQRQARSSAKPIRLRMALSPQTFRATTRQTR